jgi:hypothetical protein
MLFVTALLAAFAQQPQPPARVVVEPAALELAVDSRAALRARSISAQGAAAAPARVNWFSADPSIVTVDSAGNIRALRPGSTRVAAIVDGVAGFADITVPALPPARISAVVEGGSIVAGTSAPLALDLRDRQDARVPAANLRFESSAPGVATVDASGRVMGHAPGSATIRVAAGPVATSVQVSVVANPARSYRLAHDAARVRTGDVVRLRATGVDAGGRDVLRLRPVWLIDRDGATVEPENEDGVFVAERPGRYRVTALIGDGASASAFLDVEPREPNGRIEALGHGLTAGHHAGDTWAFEGADGRDYAIIGTFMHDWLKVWDITEPTRPVLTDSIRLDARRINDVKIHPNNRLAVVTREGASSRRNGIVLLDLSRPAHPTILSEYTETVTGGVHNVWIRGDVDLVYACHNGTSDLHIIDISDPRNPREVGRWGLDKPAKTLHDVIVQDGYAYLSYWDDGAIMLDVGAGTHGGTPTKPAFVSQFRYPEGNTHVAWRYGKYLFLGDEIFPDDWDASRPIEARGFIHVVDYSDPENPKEVARYEVPEAGTHNIWVENDLLYAGYYQAGLRVVDVSGELRGDLYRQGRELAALRTGSPDAVTPNWSMTWGAQVFKGNVVTADLNSGLWVLRFTPTRPVF